MADKTLNVKGLACPLPVLKAKKAIKDMQPGAVLEVLSTDPLSPEDFKTFCHVTGHTLLQMSEADGVYRFLIRAGS